VFVHSAEVHSAAAALMSAGISDSEIARRLAVPRSTVREWRRPRYARRTVPARCHRCWRPSRPVRFEPADYAELLGLYLGDGHITAMPRTERLRIFLDARYRVIVDETEALLRRCLPHNRVGRLVRHEGALVVLWTYHNHLSCLFPQHGAGKKHERAIELEPWQELLVQSAPWAFIKGCIRSDGCVFINRTGRYEYLSYAFDNHSDDIRALFAAACASVGVVCRAAGTSVRIYRRASVALMLEHVGTKS
jgi:Homeodomain-like domain